MWNYEKYDKCIFTLVILVVAISVTFDKVGACFVPARARARCTVLRRCTNQESVVWATDSRSCTVWRNACQLANENCQRQNRNVRILRNVTRAACQTLCTTVCTANYDPVCAEYNGEQETFANRCTLTSYVCQTGEIYEYLFNGQCPNITRSTNTTTTTLRPTTKPATK